jgi:hypothetical protein
MVCSWRCDKCGVILGLGLWRQRSIGNFIENLSSPRRPGKDNKYRFIKIRNIYASVPFLVYRISISTATRPSLIISLKLSF